MAVKNLNQILVVDVESTCWNTKQEQGDNDNEIIEIGITTLNLDKSMRYTLGDTESILVKPFGPISEFCTQLTTITPEMVNGAPRFGDALNYLKNKYNSKEKTWASWGDYDRLQFERQCKTSIYSYPFSSTHLNVKNLWAIMHRHKPCGMMEALEYMGFNHTGTHHRGSDDSRNIAYLLMNLLNVYAP